MQSIENWDTLLCENLRRLPTAEEGRVRLYRIQTAHPVLRPAWVAQMQREDSTDQARGRWFTRDPAALAFYAQELDHPILLTLDIQLEAAAAWQVDRFGREEPDGCRPRSFSRDPDREHFVPRSWLDQVHVWPLTEESLAPEPAPRKRLRR